MATPALFNLCPTAPNKNRYQFARFYFPWNSLGKQVAKEEWKSRKFRSWFVLFFGETTLSRLLYLLLLFASLCKVTLQKPVNIFFCCSDKNRDNFYSFRCIWCKERERERANVRLKVSYVVQLCEWMNLFTKKNKNVVDIVQSSICRLKRITNWGKR